MNRKYAIVAAEVLIALIFVSLFVNFTPSPQVPARQFYVGVEFAYGSQFSQVKALVDKVKGYTNLFVLGSVALTFNRTALDESCDYIYDSGLNFIVLITSYPMYNSSNGYPPSNTIFNWVNDSIIKYGSRFLGIYRFDEPGGNQLDDGTYRLINDTALSYSQVAQAYVGNLSSIVNHYETLNESTSHPVVKVFTSDYGLYWFDYASGYNTVFAEFVGNQSRETAVALDRGAAQSFNQPWGVIITWKYDQSPYLEPPSELFSDLTQAYSAGATYEIIFSFPSITPYGTLTPADFLVLQRFWLDIHTTPGSFGSAEAAYVVPANFGFGFRNADDTIWGLFPAASDSYTAKIWSDTQFLLAKYGYRLNIIFDNQTVIDPTLGEYSKVYYYNQTVT